MAAKYLLAYPQPAGRSKRFIEAEDIDAYFPERTRDTGRRIAGMVIREGAGRPNRTRLRLMALIPSRTGGLMGVGNSIIVPNTAAGVRGTLRELRPQELAELEGLDQQIARLREQRSNVLRTAWRNGHHVQVGPLRDKAEQHLRPRDSA